MPRGSIIVAGAILVFGLCLSARPAAIAEQPATEPPAGCRFTLERATPGADGSEVWVLTCHHQSCDQSTPEAGAVKRVDSIRVRPAALAEAQ
jgi:hypothetical protein